ncbi:MAG TPA: malectin domain-containing carbohydrate-binding protein, partial [Anaeromyxobacteraceae bacterium]|nr:malectin domain-containing carbohydrate-binding protein [Anaeromyxobacteraceae bacterium]
TVFTGSWGAPSISTDETAFAAAMTLNAVYAYGMAGVDAESRKAWQRSPAIPAYMKETAYELSQVGVSGTRLNLRQAMYSSILAGATTGGLYGHRDIWSFNTSTWHANVDSTASGPWSSELDSPGAFDEARVGALFGSLPWWKLVPDGQSGIGTLVTAGTGTFGGSDWIAAAAAGDGTALVAYVPPNGTTARSFSVNMAAMSGAAHARWWDPTTGLYTEIASSIANSGSRSFTTPGANSTGDNDWVLVLTPAAVSAPPTVATAASASPNPATGTSTSLSVLGADDGGEAGLVYTWSVLGTPPSPVAFSANGTNAAKNTTATFGAAGSYALQATIRDADGQTATSGVTVTVAQTATGIAVAPASATVLTGATQKFTASAYDQFGRALSTQPTFAWTVSGGGTIDGTGLFTAGSVAGGPFTVTASAGLLAGKASVTVATAASPRYQVNSGGAAAGTFSADQLFSAGSTFGTSNAIDVSAVTNPAPAAVYQAERYGNFSYAFGGLTPGAAYQVRLHFAEIWWTTAGSRLFNVSINGRQVLANFDIFATAGGANRALVEAFTAPADAGGKIVIQFTTVKDNAKVSGIEILSIGSSPPTVATAASASPNPATGTSTSLSVLGADDGGEASLV